VLPLDGFSPTTFGEVISFGPPDGATIFAQLENIKQNAENRKQKRSMNNGKKERNNITY
jgi:ApbE superfamily uncharacterized protein (UPF0280 family)